MIAQYIVSYFLSCVAAVETGVPTSVDFVRYGGGDQVVTSYTSGHVYIFDVETGKRVTTIDCSGGPGMK